jgi:protein O-mannosyl-transferase
VVSWRQAVHAGAQMRWGGLKDSMRNKAQAGAHAARPAPLGGTLRRGAPAGGTGRAGWGIALGVPFLLAVLAYLPTLGHEFVWDDVTFIAENPAAHDTASLGESLRHGYGWVPGAENRPDAYLYYRPVIVAANNLQWGLSSGKPWLFHLSNLLTHAVTAALLAAVALLLGLPAGIALLAGGIHALHPVHSEAVAWISGRTDLTAAGLAYLALALFLVAKNARRGGTWLLVGAGVSTLLALMSKESAAALLLVAPLCVLLPPSAVMAWPPWGPAGATPHPRTGARDTRGLAWLCLGGAVLLYLVLRMVALSSPLGAGAEIEGGGLVAHRGALPDRALLAGNLTLLYLLRWVVPWPLSIEAPASLQHPPYPAIWGGLGLAVLVAGWVVWGRAVVKLLRARAGDQATPPSGTAVAVASRGRGWRGGFASPPAIVGLGLFLAGILPVLQWVRVGEVYGERFLYLPAGGLLLLAGAFAVPHVHRGLRRPAVLLAALAVPYILMLEARLPAWHDELALFGREVDLHPHSARITGNLGSALVKRGQLTEAEPYLVRAVQLDPTDARMQAQLGSLLVDLGRADEGVPMLERAAEQMRPTKSLLKNLGIGRTRQGRFAEAADALRQALERDPSDAGTLDALALAERKLGRLDEATALFERALAIDPERRSCYLNLIGLHYFDRRDLEAARMWGERFLARFPNAPEAAGTRRLLAQTPPPAGAAGTPEQGAR